MVQTLDPSVGGVAPAVIGLTRGLIERGHEVELLTLDEPGAAWLGGIDFVVHALGPGLTSYRYSKHLRLWLARAAMEYDRVIIHGLWQYLSFAAWQQFRGAAATPYYVFPHGMLDPWFKRTFPLKHIKKWCYWPWAEYRVLRDAAAVIFTSEQERLDARSSFWLYRCREAVSPLGIQDPAPVGAAAREQFLARFPQVQNADVLLFLGRLHPKKGCDMLIESLPRGSDDQIPVALVLAGPDQIGWEKQLRARASYRGISSQVVFAGMLDGTLKQGAMASAAALVLPSHQENFGMAVVEALAQSVPVLISDKINIWREIDADRAGYVENDDLAGTTRLVERWIATPPAEREAMRLNARNCFLRRFEIDRAVDSFLDILEKQPSAR